MGGPILSHSKEGLKPVELHGFTAPETLPRQPWTRCLSSCRNIQALGKPSAFSLSPVPPGCIPAGDTRGDGSSSPGRAPPPAIAGRSCRFSRVLSWRGAGFGW